MRIKLQKVKGKEYLQYVDAYGHVFHIDPADDLENWKIASWLYGYGIFEKTFQFNRKVQGEIEKRFPTEKSDLSGFTGSGIDGYVGFNEAFKNRLTRIYDTKAIEFDKLRDAVQQKFPDIKTKEALRATVLYNYKMRQKG